MRRSSTKYASNVFEKTYWASGELLCGIDEVGRGSLMGPLVVGCVILPPYCDVGMLVDSKILSEKKRMTAAVWIRENCIFSIISIDPWIVDSIGINKSTELAVRRAFCNVVQQLQKPVKLILADHMNIGVLKIGQTPIVSAPYGESWSSSIAAASIVAKVFRDKVVSEMSTMLPTFLLEKNKGYGTKKHIDGLLKAGLSALHRKTYCKTFLLARLNRNAI